MQFCTGFEAFRRFREMRLTLSYRRRNVPLHHL